MPNPKNIGNGSKRPSISEALTASLGLHEYPSVFGSTGFSGNAGFGTIERKPKPETYLGRSYVGSFSNPGSLLAREGGVTTPDSVHLPLHREHTGRNSVHDGGNLHRQTAALNDYFGGYNGSVMELDHDVIEDGNYLNSGYSGKGGVLLPVSVIEGNNCQANTGEDVAEEEEALIDAFEDELEAVTRVQLSPITSRGSNHYGAIPVQPLYERSSVYESSEFHGLAGRVRKVGLQTVSYIPAVILGMLLNVLDALSYGMIIFPIAEPVFSHLGPTGLTMFYVSTIVSQVVYSSGFSTFNAGIGSQMVEVTPFFHTMAQSILGSLGESRSEEVISTTIVCYAMSSVLTGIAFMLLGKLRLGKIVGFFPRHILIGCIGGVAYFLIITGVEVTSRVPRFEYTWSFLGTLFADFEAFAKWALPAVMTAVLVVLQHWVEGSLLLPTYYLVSFMLFHFMVAAIPSISLHLLRDKGWIFQVVSTDERWYSFYKLYDFKLVQWRLVAKQIPTMLALTFFGVLHVPINVPALAILCGVDNLDVDKELLAHGYSNFLSGLMGSIQNYLVYTNTVLFIRAGADTKYAGILLAIGTAIFMIIGPVIISFIPICIVGSLMYLLGYELLKEVLYDTWGKVSNFEYITIVIIVLTMGIYDFVGGILVGILIAVISFLIDSTKLQTVNGEFTGKVAKSAVYRDYLQTKFLDKVGEQIYVMKLQNILFFGTIVSIEERIEKLFEVTEKDADKKMIKYLILDFKNIMADNIDYSAAEGFNRIKRLLESKRITLIISSISRHDRIYHAFNKVGLLESVELFGDLNSALEWCENEFLVRYKELFYRVHLNKTKRKDGAKSWDTFNLQQANTPRKSQVLTVAERVLSAEHQLNDLNAVYQSNQPVLPLLLLCLKRFRPKVLSNDKDEVKLWRQLCPYFKHTRIPASTPIANEGNIFFLLESGVVKIHYHFTQGTIYEAMSGRTCYGSIQDYNIQLPASSISTETDCALWIIDSQSLQRLQEENLKLYTELLMVYLSITQYRFKELLSYSLISN